MIRIFEICCLLAALASQAAAQGLAPSPASPASTGIRTGAHDVYDVVAVEFTGLERTSRDWVTSYLDLSLPARLSRDDAKRLQRRLLTTAVFSEVRVLFVAAPPPSPVGTHILQIDVVERWTTIPVLRIVYGGGTPLRIAGLYDIHALGRLLTVGGEAQKYGNAPIGSVLYAKSPRHSAGRYFLASELWREYRRRPVYVPRDTRAASAGAGRPRQIGTMSTNVTMSRLAFLSPLLPVAGALASYPWKVGGELMWFSEAPLAFEPADGAPAEPPQTLGSVSRTTRNLRVLPTLMYDDIDLNILDFDGFRLVAKGGPSYVTGDVGEEQSSWHGFGELEAFWFKLYPAGFNLGLHAVVGGASFKSARSQYFLGGLDSIRGFPDGVVHGTRASWLNAELRHTSWKPTRYTWIQSVAFCDAGGAANDWDRLNQSLHASCGVGARLAVPQVNRMIFRLDYAWAVDGSGQQGIAAGMNQFFDPYKPLSDR
jgi:hypothetical protein